MSRWRDSGWCWDHSPGAPVVPWVCSFPSLGFYLDIRSKRWCGQLSKPAHTSSKLSLFLCFSLSLQTWHLVLFSGSGVHLVKWATVLTKTGWTILANDCHCLEGHWASYPTSHRVTYSAHWSFLVLSQAESNPISTLELQAHRKESLSLKRILCLSHLEVQVPQWGS